MLKEQCGCHRGRYFNRQLEANIFQDLKKKRKKNILVDLCQLYNTVETKKGFAVTLDELPL